jgi:hypothetical protein
MRVKARRREIAARTFGLTDSLEKPGESVERARWEEDVLWGA